MADKTEEMTNEERAAAVNKLIEAAKPLFADYTDGSIPGAALGELTAMWLASHVVEGDPEETDKYRNGLLGKQIRYILTMTSVIDAENEADETSKGH